MAKAITVHLDLSAIEDAFSDESLIKKNATLTQRIMAQSNEYAKEDTGVMRGSVVGASIPEKGEINWATEYAQYAYEGGVPSKQKNPNAQLRWFDYAESRHGDEWIKLAGDLFSE